eukprot:c17537_g1_i1.p2 GENE.c17537_g1_i1~~c17537_g1_i1.p2  ORF type:complete len:128 (+),score=17.99 c17537_g1_i1:365-748(+)
MQSFCACAKAVLDVAEQAFVVVSVNNNMVSSFSEIEWPKIVIANGECVISCVRLLSTKELLKEWFLQDLILVLDIPGQSSTSILPLLWPEVICSSDHAVNHSNKKRRSGQGQAHGAVESCNRHKHRH